MKIIAKFIAFAALSAAAPSALAAPIVSLPGGTAVAMTGQNQGGAAQSFGPGITYSGQRDGYYGYSNAWGFSGNGQWNGTAMIGANEPATIEVT